VDECKDGWRHDLKQDDEKDRKSLRVRLEKAAERIKQKSGPQYGCLPLGNTGAFSHPYSL
jgi:hypothetical protein